MPNGTNANIDNGGTATLQTNVSDITTLDVVGPAFGTSQLSVLSGADLTTTGNAVIGSGALTGSEAFVTQSGGTLSLGANLTVGSGDSYGEWAMTNGTVEVANDLTVGSGTDGVFSMSDGGVTVHGGINVADSSGLGTMTVSGGALVQDGATDSFSVGASGSGTLRIEGDTPTINVTKYEQGPSGSLDLVLNDNGITTINASGDVTLGGALNVTIASGASPTPGIYDIIAAQGTRTGGFSTLNLPEDVALRYDDSASSAIKLYVGVEAPAMDFSIIDSFNEGSHEAVYRGVNISTYTGPGPIGDERVLRAYNNHTNNSARVTVDAVAGTCEFWGDTNAANRGVNWGTTNSTEASGSIQLNLDMTDAVAFEIDVVSNTGFDYPQLTPTIYLRTNNGEPTEKDFSFNLSLSASPDPFTVTVPIGNFRSGGDPMTTADLEDVDGIRIYSYQNGTLVMDEIRVTSPGSVGGEVPEPAGLGLIGWALLAVRKRRS